MPNDNPTEWLLTFNQFPKSKILGRPFGEGTPISNRAINSEPPWDLGCEVEFLNGGDKTLNSIKAEFQKAIESANDSGVPMGDNRGHVYIAGWRFNPNRSFPSSTSPPDTAWKLISDLMKAGIKVRILIWYPLFQSGPVKGFKPHVYSHLFLAHLVRGLNNQLKQQNNNLTSDLGVVFLDMRLSCETSIASGRGAGDEFPVSSHHQKFIVIRGLTNNVAFCGGIDLAYTRIDSPPLEGDIQSGDNIPKRGLYIDLPTDNGTTVKVIAPNVVQASDLPSEVYGPNQQIWHDQHLKLKGPIVSTLERIFTYRWEQWPKYTDVIPKHTMPRIINTENGKVLSTSSDAFTGDSNNPIKKLELCVAPIVDVKPIESISTESYRVDSNTGKHIRKTIIQPWQTLPTRWDDRRKYPFFTGEFSFMAGLIKPCKKAQDLILIFDQYFWHIEYARFLAEQIRNKDHLHLIIILPPSSDQTDESDAGYQHYLRRKALTALFDNLENNEQKERIGVYGLWNTQSANTSLHKRGIYCHAKVQAFDQSLLVCGSANINRRSFTNDTELSCAVLDDDFVRDYYRDIWQFLFNEELTDDKVLFSGANWAAEFFSRFKNIPRNLITEQWKDDIVYLPTQQVYTRKNNIKPGKMEYQSFDPISFPTNVEKIVRKKNGKTILPTLEDQVKAVENDDTAAIYRIKL